jgi:hypothetical protein
LREIAVIESPDESALIEVWDRGRGGSSGYRGLLLAKLAYPSLATESIGERSVGWRDYWLYDLRRRLFGPEIRSDAHCPGCGAGVEVALDIASLGLVEPAAQAEVGVVLDQTRLRFRLPSVADLVSLPITSTTQNSSELCRWLVERCLLDDAVDVGDSSWWDEDALSVVSAAMADADPIAEVLLRLACAECDNLWKEPLDILQYLWLEIELTVLSIIGDVITLASAFGWTEHDVLALSPARRHLYVEQVGS